MLRQNASEPVQKAKRKVAGVYEGSEVEVGAAARAGAAAAAGTGTAARVRAAAEAAMSAESAAAINDAETSRTTWYCALAIPTANDQVKKRSWWQWGNYIFHKTQ